MDWFFVCVHLIYWPYMFSMAAATVASPAVEPVEPHHDVKLFNRWSFDDIQVSGFYAFVDSVLFSDESDENFILLAGQPSFNLCLEIY